MIHRYIQMVILCALAASWQGLQAQRTRDSIGEGWRFALGHATDPAQDFGHATGYFSYLAKTGFGDGPANPAFDDRAWREVSIPHDWAVELGFSEAASYSHGFKMVGPGFPENSVGWYRRELEISKEDLGKRIRIEFDGIYRDAAVFVNGFFLGQEPSGYVSQSYDITEYLDYGGSNVVAVRVDASMEEGWYYEGAGIYRHAYLLKTDPLHVARYGTAVTTSQSKGKATVQVETSLVNEDAIDREGKLLQLVFDPEGKLVSTAKPITIELTAGASLAEQTSFVIKEPSLWDLDTPNLYTLVSELSDKSGKRIDRYETTFGIRDIRFDPNHGFFLNGRSVKLKGSNNHQDHAGIGAALPDAMQEYRIRALKEMGSNAYRVSHHHASPALLEACDRLGMLVIDETRIMGINDYHLGQLEHLILRDRNHPSVILWSIGNEEWAIEGNILGARITERMQQFAKRLDPSRRVTAAVSGGWGGISSAVDVFGVNYIKHGDVDQQHLDYPNQIIIGTEETTTQQTRGIYVEDAALAHQPPREDGSSGGNAEQGWRFYAERDYTSGVFFWTGFDYRGEATPYGWPAVLSQFGILDNCGFPKDGYYYLKSWWSEEPVLHIFPHWNWPGREGETIEVRAHSNYEEVELFLNGESLGRKEMPVNDHLAWEVVYEPGELKALGYRDGKVLEETIVRTTGSAVGAALLPDRSEISADGKDLSVVEVQLLDDNGDVMPVADDLLWFSIEGPGKIIGVGNGNPSSLEPDVFVETIEVNPLGDWQAPPAWQTDQPLSFTATFDLPQIEEGQEVELLLNGIGKEQTVLLNGEPLYESANKQQARKSFALVDLDLQLSGNVLEFSAQPYSEWGDREDLAQIQPAVLKIRTEPEQYRRQAFNGLVQVIVQSTGDVGTIRLRASGEGLAESEVEIEAR